MLHSFFLIGNHFHANSGYTFPLWCIAIDYHTKYICTSPSLAVFPYKTDRFFHTKKKKKEDEVEISPKLNSWPPVKRHMQCFAISSSQPIPMHLNYKFFDFKFFPSLLPNMQIVSNPTALP